ncbi:unnamed protein product, partial [Ectocarpus sp. 12 AP-2014]
PASSGGGGGGSAFVWQHQCGQESRRPQPGIGPGRSTSRGRRGKDKRPKRSIDGGGRGGRSSGGGRSDGGSSDTGRTPDLRQDWGRDANAVQDLQDPSRQIR